MIDLPIDISDSINSSILHVAWFFGVEERTSYLSGCRIAIESFNWDERPLPVEPLSWNEDMGERGFRYIHLLVFPSSLYFRNTVCGLQSTVVLAAPQKNAKVHQTCILLQYTLIAAGFWRKVYVVRLFFSCNILTQVKLGPGAGISYGTREGGIEARGCLGGPARVKILSRARTPAFRLSPPYVLRFWPSASLTFTCSLTPMLLLWSLHEQHTISLDCVSSHSTHPL